MMIAKREKETTNKKHYFLMGYNEIKSYFSILIYFVFLMLVFSGNMVFAISCSEVKERTTLDYCRNDAFSIADSDVDGNKPVIRKNIEFSTFNPYKNREYFYDKRNRHCLIWGLGVSLAYSAASITANTLCKRVGGTDVAEKAAKVSKLKATVSKFKAIKSALERTKGSVSKSVGGTTASIFTDPIIVLQIELAIDMASILVNTGINLTACISHRVGCAETATCTAAGIVLSAIAESLVFATTRGLYDSAENKINKVKLCGYDWENYAYTKYDLENYNFNEIHPQKGGFSNSYSYKLEKCFQYGNTEAKAKFGVDCNDEVAKNYCDLGNEKCKDISISSKDIKNRLYREILNGGKEFKISTSYHSRKCIDPRPEWQKGFSGLEQRYYFRGSESAHYLCNRFKFQNQGCVLDDGTVIEASELNEPDKKAKCKQVFEQAYTCCKNRAGLGVCMYNVEDHDNYGRDTKSNTMCLRQLNGDDDAEECEVEIYGRNPTFIAFSPEGNVGKICVKNTNFCPYSYNLDGGTIAKDEYCDGDYSCNHSTCDLKYSGDDDKIQNCKNKMSNDVKKIWHIENGKKIATPSYGQTKNFLSYNAHCTDIGDIGSGFAEMPDNKYLPKVCFDFVGDSRNLPIPLKPVDLNSPVTRYLVAGVDFDLGQYRGFTAPMAQCFKETLSNIFNNRAGMSVCKDPDEEINAEGLCGTDSFDHPEKIDKEKYIYMIGDKLPDDENIFYKIQSRLQLIIKLLAVLAIIVIGINFLLSGDLNIFGNIKKPRALVVGMVKFALVFYFAVGSAWQTHFYKWLDDSLGFLYKKTFELSLLNYKTIKANSKELVCTKTEEKTEYRYNSEETRFYENTTFKIPESADSLKFEVYGASGNDNSCYGGDLRTLKDSFIYDSENFDYRKNYDNGTVIDAGCMKGNENCEDPNNENSCWVGPGRRFINYYKCSNGVWQSFGYCGDEKPNEPESSFIYVEKVIYENTNTIKSFKIPDDVIKIEVEAYGGNGGGRNSYAKGGYSKGALYLTGENQTIHSGDYLYIVVGGNGSCNNGGSSTAGYNGGGYDATDGCGRNRGHGCGGGGATHLAKVSGLLKNLSSNDVLLVAGGGGGQSEGELCGGSGGGANLDGSKGCHDDWYGAGGTISSGGKGSHGNASGGFGYGGNVTRNSHDEGKWCGGAGGAGYYGGGAGEWSGDNGGGGGGGSGFCGNDMQDCTGSSGTSQYPGLILYVYHLKNSNIEEHQKHNLGGYSYGTLKLDSNSLNIKNGDVLYINVGKMTNDNSPAGATDIRINNSSSLTCDVNDPRIIVAGAAGNGSVNGGAGGGNGNGQDSLNSTTDGKGGTLTSGGDYNGICGFGASNSRYISGGDGWYGGGYGTFGGGGGSGYVSSALINAGGVQGGNPELNGFAVISTIYSIPFKVSSTINDFVVENKSIANDIENNMEAEKCYVDNNGDKDCYSNCKILDKIDNSGNVEYVWDEKYDGCYFGDEKYPKGKGYLALFDSLDCKLMNYFAYTPDLDLPGILVMILLSLLWSPLAVVVVLLGFLLFIILLSIAIKIFYTFLMSFFAVNILIYISPIIFPALLFKKYKSIFDTWLSKLIGYSFQLVFITVFAGFVITTFDKIALGNNKYMNHDPVTGRLPIIICDENTKFDSLICLFGIPLNKGEVPAFGNTLKKVFGIGPMMVKTELFSGHFVETVIALLKSCLILYVLLQFMKKMDRIIYEITGTGALSGGNVGIKETLGKVKNGLDTGARVARYSAITAKDTAVRSAVGIKNGITDFRKEYRETLDQAEKRKIKEKKDASKKDEKENE